MGAVPLRATTPEFVAYSDETNWNKGRHRAVAVVSMSIATSHQLGPAVVAILRTAFTECKWSKLKSNDRTRAALDALMLLLDAAADERLRIDVLTWDIEDSRHAVRGRDDIANLGRMHYWAYVKGMERWPGASWMLNPDRHADTDWETLTETLHWTGARPVRDSLWHHRGGFRVVGLIERDSAEAPFVQLADLLAGMAAYSREEFDRYAAWQALHSRQEQLFDVAGPPIELSTRDRARWPLIEGFAAACRDRRLGVSLTSSGGLRTADPKRPVNFWWWTPQGEYDKAPRT